MEGTELKNAALILAPYGPWITILSVSTAAGSQNLALCGGNISGAAPTPDNPSVSLDDILFPVQQSNNPNYQGMLGRYMRIRAVGTTVGWIHNATQALVTGANAPVLATTGAQGTAGNCDQLIANEWQDVWVSANTAWLGFVGAGTGTLIIRPSSRGGSG